MNHDELKGFFACAFAMLGGRPGKRYVSEYQGNLLTIAGLNRGFIITVKLVNAHPKVIRVKSLEDIPQAATEMLNL